MGKSWPSLGEIAMVVIAVFIVLAFFKGWG
jgi:hypothetical protein